MLTIAFVAGLTSLGGGLLFLAIYRSVAKLQKEQETQQNYYYIYEWDTHELGKRIVWAKFTTAEECERVAEGIRDTYLAAGIEDGRILYFDTNPHNYV